MPRKSLVAGAALLAAVLVALGFFWPFRHRPEVLRLPGVVETQEVRLGSKIGGRVAKVLVNEGDIVEPGQVLVQFDIPETLALRDQWRARLRSAEANRDKAINGPLPEEKEQAQNDLEAAQADVKLAEQELARVDRLYRQSAMSRADYDNARAARDRSQARLGVARARVKLLARGTRDEEKDAARAQVAELKAKLQELEANIAEADVRAPSRAVVEVLSVRKGDLVPANQPVVRILRADDLWVKVYVPETDLGKVRLGQTADVNIDSYPGRHFEGKVIQIASISEFTPRNVQSADERRHQVFGIKVRVADPEGIFKSGMAAEVTLPLQP
jgi:HlyD family secretion protein